MLLNNKLFRVLSHVNKYGSIFSKSIISLSDIKRGTMIYRLSNYTQHAYPTFKTIQTSHNIHVNDKSIISYMNHSCNPCCNIDTLTYKVYANKDIKKHDELTFFYPSTEWSLKQPFLCRCGNKNCIGYVYGAYDLNVSKYTKTHFMNLHILEMYYAKI